MVAPAEIQNILQKVREWPLEDRVQLAKAVLAMDEVTSRSDSEAIAKSDAGGIQQRPSFSKAYGIALGDRPPPTDEEVKQIIYDHRMKKYGS